MSKDLNNDSQVDRNEIETTSIGQRIVRSDDFASEDSIDFTALLLKLWEGKYIIAGITSLAAIIGVVYAISLPNVYRSEVLLSPISDEQQGGIAALAGQFGGLASLAGIDLSGDGSEKSEIALEVAVSREFVTEFINTHELLVPLMASDGWVFDTNELIYDEDIYSVEDDEWVRDVSWPLRPKPSMLEAHEAFLEIFSLSPRKDSAMVIFAIEHHSPYIAKQWLDLFVKDLNARMKVRDQRDAKRSMDYLQQQLEITNIAEIQNLLYQLIEEQTKTLMFSEIRDEYVFETIDQAIVTEEKYKPNRANIAVLAFLIGSILGCAYVLIKGMFERKGVIG